MAPEGPAPAEERLNDAASCLLCLAKGTLDCPHVPSRPAEVRVLEVEAFGSVQDLIHACIFGRGGRATLSQIYQLCNRRGRIAYKRSSGGSRLITQNEHWKSQIRHALYTNGGFQRCPDSPDAWRLTPGLITGPPNIVRVLVREGQPAPEIKEGAGTTSSAQASDPLAGPPNTATATAFPERSLSSRAGGPGQLNTPLPAGDRRVGERRRLTPAATASSSQHRRQSARLARYAADTSLVDDAQSSEVEQHLPKELSPGLSSSYDTNIDDPASLRWGRKASRSALALESTLHAPPARWCKKARRGTKQYPVAAGWEEIPAHARSLPAWGSWEPAPRSDPVYYQDQTARSLPYMPRPVSPVSTCSYDDRVLIASQRLLVPPPPSEFHHQSNGGYGYGRPDLAADPRRFSPSPPLPPQTATFGTSGSVSPTVDQSLAQRRASEQLQAMVAQIARAAESRFGL